MENTGISWTGSFDANGNFVAGHTHNEWWGCSSTAGAGCAACYAAALDKRTGGNFFGIGTSPRLTKDANRNKPYAWNRAASASGVRKRVFCGSMMDFFDKNAPAGARDGLWKKISETPALDWLVLTKRPSNVPKMLPADWNGGYHNVWLGVTVEDRKSGLRRLEMLKGLPAMVKFASVEPLIEDLGDVSFSGIDWVIVGGESGSSPRPMKREWAENVLAAARRDGCSVFFKQWGGRDASAGGCLFDGLEVKEWPDVVAAARRAALMAAKT